MLKLLSALLLVVLLLVQGEARFDSVAIVYYPGVDFFADMMLSEYYQAIYGDKQVGDTQAVMTVPILDRL